jgi:nitroimidazol reductase NimA-like FMN-containing flavoprotein (pyridoxamine 5'-phosphate oxidase superfamily)
MEFNKINRGAKREVNNQETLYQILDAGFLCHIGFQHEGRTLMIPTAYGRKEDMLYIHGSVKNFMLNQIINQQTICIAVTHLDGIVLARSLFHTSVNYRSAVLFGTAQLVENNTERIEGMKIITENIIQGRWDEVPMGTESEIKATMVVKFKIETASAKIRNEGPAGDDGLTTEVWSGHIPLVMKALEPIQDNKFGHQLNWSKSVQTYIEKNS